MPLWCSYKRCTIHIHGECNSFQKIHGWHLFDKRLHVDILKMIANVNLCIF
uniref:Uncharacterized protein n=1 Tax=Lepeophtheirus salmonis TaxID=72036 RepID=A0A0K2U5T2_LEPSM